MIYNHIEKEATVEVVISAKKRLGRQPVRHLSKLTT